MLEELFNLVKHNAGDAVINNPDVPDDKNDAMLPRLQTPWLPG